MWSTKDLSFTLQGLGIRHRAWKLLGRLSSDTEKEDGSSQTAEDSRKNVNEA